MNASFVYALELKYPTIFGMSINNSSRLPDYAKYFYNIAMMISGTLAVVVVLFGGIYYLISFGRGKFTDEGKSWIKAGAIGLILTLSAYLISYTINPNLVIFDLKGLTPITLLSNYLNPPKPSPPIEIYSEIPIGILTENVLSGTMDCYDYDNNGDPISGSQITTDSKKTINGPTYLEHDRVDCFLKLSQAAEKKSQVIKKLSDEIIKLMEQCSCSSSYTTGSGSSQTTEPSCKSKCKNDGNDCLYESSKSCPIDNSKIGCTDPCKDTCQDKSCSPSVKNSSCCPTDVKDKIDHGKIKITDCYGLEKEFVGLDEFRSQFSNNFQLIKAKVEIQPQQTLNGKPITIINNGNCTACNFQCPTCNSTSNDYAKCLKERDTCQKNEATCKNNLVKCLKQNSPWYNLRLIDQLTYLQGKMMEIKSKVQADVKNLEKGESALGQCYLADTYVDFLKTYEQTNKEKKILIVNKEFSDTTTQQKINSEKYCQGFQYDNSVCYSQCKDICPGMSQKDFDCYSSCIDCTGVDPDKKQECLTKQTTCEKKCYENRTCISSNGLYNTFSECMTGCKKQCLNDCGKACSSSDSAVCQNKCNNDSQCLINNEDKCLVDFSQLKTCTTESTCENQCNKNQNCIETCRQQYSDYNFIKNCIETSASLCTYCSDQYAGYPECLTSNYSTKGKYSASYIYQHPDYQICTYPYKEVLINNTDEDGNITKTSTTCLSLYPETAKCPAASKCPQCPCSIVNEKITYQNQPVLTTTSSSTCGTSSSSSGGGSSTCQTTDPNKPGYCSGGRKCINGVCSGTSSSSSSSGSGSSQTITEYRVCSANCDKFAFNDDPLTFFCQQSWWNKEEAKDEVPIGNYRVCPKEREIPVGRAVDDAEKWGNDFMNSVNSVTKKVEDMLQYIKTIGEKKDYCNCDSKCEDGKEAICQDKCVYNQVKVEETSPSDGSISYKWQCTCSRTGCQGNPCQMMLNLLKGKSKDQECSKGIEDKGINYYSIEITNGIKDFMVFMAQGGRSDIVKELIYSRNKTHECSAVQKNYGTQTRALSCTRVENEIISPTVDSYSKTIVGNKAYTSYCYGKSLGEISKSASPLTDNWFCCEEREDEKEQ